MSKNSKYFIPMPESAAQMRIGERPSSLHPDHKKNFEATLRRIRREEKILSEYGHPMVISCKKADLILKGQTHEQ